MTRSSLDVTGDYYGVPTLITYWSGMARSHPYNPELYRKANLPPAHREVSVDQTIFILQRQGYLITAPALSA